ncbi:hypothetical protein MJO28_007309 [Puccinia striiformis f. sp. tritici]|uniref:Uncharacterized protein n=1 Tax=Puccinia striiformis f. sp. tritici TaxID=168172 RepID=A0ACC0EF27_9BASI|nr:hypothetical protein MJO28_007309 [Puccinia striiformis f. sp. tritici]KAI7955855.1 hypothetical protein MJO29_007254 [Puccinia striiformis f. sp. tritici]
MYHSLRTCALKLINIGKASGGVRCGGWPGKKARHPSHANDISSQEAMNIDDRSDPEANTSSVSTQEVTSSSTSEAVIDAHLALLIEFII